METKTMTIRVPEDLAAWIENQKGNNSSNIAIVNALYSAMLTQRYSDYEIKGKLTEDEWKYLADSLNGTRVDGTFRFASSALVASIEDSDRIDGLGAKWEVDVKKLCDKIENMSGSQIEAVYRRVEFFWNKPEDLDAWAKY